MNIIEAFKNANLNLAVAKAIKADLLKKGIENEFTALDLYAPLDLEDLLLLSLTHGKETELPFALIKKCLPTEEGREILQRAIDAIHSIDVEEFTPLDLALAVITECSKSKHGREILTDVIDEIEPNESSMIKSELWNFLLAVAYYRLEQSCMALKYFERADESEHSEFDFEEYITSCIARLSFAYFKQNFRQRVQAAWISFLEQEKQLRKQFDKVKTQSDFNAVQRKLHDIFKQASPYFISHIVFNGYKYQLVFSHNLDCMTLIQLCYLKEQAPQGLLKNWDIVIGIPAVPNKPVDVNGVKITAENVVMSLSYEHQKFKILAYCPKLQILGTPQHVVEDAIDSLIRYVLGELAYAAYIINYEILDSPDDLFFRVIQNTKKNNMMLLSDLPNALTSKGLSLDIDEKSVIESSKLSYFSNKSLLGNLRWRQDIVAGTNYLLWMHEDYTLERDLRFNMSAQRGISLGFIVVPLNSMAGNDVSSEVGNLRLTFEAFMQAEGRQAVAKIVGGATGLKYCYIDLIVWDYESFTDVARYFFRRQEVDRVYFRTCYSSAKTIIIKDGKTFPFAVVEDLPLDQKRFADSDEADKYYENIDDSDESFKGDAEVNEASMTEALITHLPHVMLKQDGDVSNDSANNEKLDYIKNVYEQSGVKACVETLLEWHHKQRFNDLVQVLEGLDRKYWTTKHVINIAACLICYGVRGDAMLRVHKYKADRAILRVIDLLKEYESDGQYFARWNKFMAFAFSTISGREETAIEYANKWAKIDLDDEEAQRFIILLKLNLGQEESVQVSEDDVDLYVTEKSEFVSSLLRDQECLYVEALSEILDKSFGKKGRLLRWLKWR